MKTYNLFLDESGQFVENATGDGRPAIVAGYLMASEKKDFENWAEDILKKTKDSRKYFRNIDIAHFHAMEDKSDEMSEFITFLIEKINEEDNVKLVSFKNEHGVFIVDPDITYLNTFADGLIQLIRLLLTEPDEMIRLRIKYAHRIYVNCDDPYPPTIHVREYVERIKERVALRLSRLPQDVTNRLQLEWSDASATDAPTLMVADAVCAALRGKRGFLTGKQEERIDRVPRLDFSVLENDIWNLIQEFIAENRLADAIYTWCIHSDKLTLSQSTTEFPNLLIERIKSMNQVGVDSQFQTLSKMIGAFVDRSLIARNETVQANKVMDPILKELFPSLQKAGIDVLRPAFDLWFYRLTTASHDGDTAKEVEAIKECESLYKQIKWTFEDTDYIMTYKIRKNEHEKNIFNFCGAEKDLKSKIKSLEQARECLEVMLGAKEEMHTDKYVTLGKMYGSLVGAQCYMIQDSNITEEDIRENSNKAIENFTEDSQLLRQYQIRAQVEYSLGNYLEALYWLKKSVKLSDDNGLPELLQALVEQGNLFGLMHYGKIMERACIDNNYDLGTKLYRQWNGQRANSVLEGDKEGIYPFYVIYGSLGMTRAILKIGTDGQNAALKAFNKAIEKAELKPENFTCYAAGLSYEAKALALVIKKEDERKERRETLLIHLNDFLHNEQVPPTIKQVFSGWQEFFSDNAIDSDMNGFKDKILTKALQVPIL